MTTDTECRDRHATTATGDSMTLNVLAALAAIAGPVIAALLIYGIVYEARHAQELDDQGWPVDWTDRQKRPWGGGDL